MDAVEQEVFEPSREQMAHVERLSIEHAPQTVAVKLDPKARTLTATIDGTFSRGVFVYDENGDEVDGPPIESASVDFPLELARRLLGDGPVALALEGVGPRSKSPHYETRDTALGEVLGPEIIAAIERLPIEGEA